MTKRILLIITLATISLFTYAQGVSFSYLIPKNGYITAPVSPFSVRGIGIGGKVGIETGASLYNIPGLAMTDLPFSYNKPLIGPMFSILAPLQLYWKIPMKGLQVKLLAGGFGWVNLNPKINTGNMDRAYRSYENWQVLNTDFKLKSKPGYGLMGGVEFAFKVSRKFTFTTEFQYLYGSSKTSISGSYTGGGNGQAISTKNVNLDASTLIQGLEISLGVKF